MLAEKRSREDMEQEIAELKVTQAQLLRLLRGNGKCEPVTAGATSDTASSTADEVTRMMLKSARDIDTLVLASGYQLQVCASSNVVVCRTCAPDFEPMMSTDRAGGEFRFTGIKGAFGYNMSLGTSFSRQGKLPREFLSLKSVVKSHFMSAAHLVNYKKREAEREEIAKRMKAEREEQERARWTTREQPEKRRKGAASKTILVLRNAYQALRAPWSREAYEDITSLRHLK